MSRHYRDRAQAHVVQALRPPEDAEDEIVELGRRAEQMPVLDDDVGDVDGGRGLKVPRLWQAHRCLLLELPERRRQPPRSRVVFFAYCILL